MGRYRSRGSITVFLSLVSVLFLSLICTTVESARIQGARAQTANITDMGNYSLFGEYEKKLLEDYELFAVDGSYGTGDFSIGRVNERLQTYLSVNARPKREWLSGLCFDPWNLRIDGSEITEYALLSDGNGETLYQQAVAYMRATAITGGVGKLFAYYRDGQTAWRQQEEYRKNRNSSEQGMQDLKRQEAEKRKEREEQRNRQESQGQIVIEEAGPSETPKKENPLKTLDWLRRKSILDIVCGDSEVSAKNVSSWELPSRRFKRKGTMRLENRYGSLADNLLFREYLLDHFPDYTGEGSQTALDYQMEYLIAGKTSDKANLRSVIQRLLLLREGMNYLYCVNHVEMNAQAGSLATLLIGWTGIAPLVAVMKHALLLGWAYGESLMDVRILLRGGRIPLAKTADTWAVTLDQLVNLKELLEGGGNDRQKGLDYRDYLRVLLNMQSVSGQKKRTLDLVELNLKKFSGLSNFRIDHCVVGIRETTEWTILPVFARIPSAFLGTSARDCRVVVESGFAYH